MGCTGCGNKSGGSAPKKMPNWGMTAKPAGAKKSSSSGGANFGTPKVKMSFSGKNRSGY